ncbi:MAG: cobyrinate a,c-diamide synthase [Planctomycetales bacterium]|nr:cobyrinate a,c-diamide synthase [Planctomycetales bacterium]
MAEGVPIPRLVVAGTASGVGKTTITVGLAGALRARGLRVAVFKCGPDYLDPTYHSRVAGVPCENLDGWMMGREAVLETFLRASEGADLALVEGVMGLYDGASPTSEEGSTAEIAKWLSAPVVLVVDVSGMARSVAAVAAGFAGFDRDLRLAGMVGNRVGSRAHLDLLRRAAGSPPVVGGMPRDPSLAFPERHLGLHTADPRAVPDRLLEACAERTAEWLDLDRLLEAARGAPPLRRPAPARRPGPPRGPCRIGVAWDEAFHFYYEDNLRRLESEGATLVRFSPLRESRLPPVDGLYFGGGYPELHAETLSGNLPLREDVAAFAARGGPIYAECGGLMYLSAGIRTVEDRRHAMVGLIPAEAVMADRLRSLGYVEVETQVPSVLGPAGLRFRGHQFRYSELRPLAGDLGGAYRIRGRRGSEATLEGYGSGGVLASYVHAHWASNPTVAAGFVAACARYARGDPGTAFCRCSRRRSWSRGRPPSSGRASS